MAITLGKFCEEHSLLVDWPVAYHTAIDPDALR